MYGRPMAKLLAFNGIDGKSVWINPSHVCLVKQHEPGKVTVVVGSSEPQSLVLAGEAEQVVYTLSRKMGWTA